MGAAAATALASVAQARAAAGPLRASRGALHRGQPAVVRGGGDVSVGPAGVREEVTRSDEGRIHKRLRFSVFLVRNGGAHEISASVSGGTVLRRRGRGLGAADARRSGGGAM